jgi:hypothetical protein
LFVCLFVCLFCIDVEPECALRWRPYSTGSWLTA